MGDRLPTDAIDRDRLLGRWVLPSVGALVAMTVGFVVVAAVLFVQETAIRGNVWTERIALSVMFVVPHAVAGVWVGRGRGVAVEPPIAASVAPVLVLLLGLFIHGGPVLTPFRAPGVLAAAVGIWATVFALGMVAGHRLRQAR